MKRASGLIPRVPFWRNPQHSPSILIVGEEISNVDFYSQLICKVRPCQIDSLTHGADLVNGLNRAHYELAVMDDAQAGLSLLTDLRRVSPLTSIILLTSRPQIEEAVEAMRLGATDYLSKPLDAQAFQLAVRRALEKQTIFEKNTGTEPFLRLLSSCQLISGALGQKEIFEIVASYFLNELNAALAVIYTLTENQPVLMTVPNHQQQDFTLCEIVDHFLKTTSILSELISKNERYRLVEEPSLGVSFFLFRFRCTGTNDYCCISIAPHSPESLESFEDRLQILSTQLEVTGKNIEYYLGVQKLAYIDHATGLYNARYLNPILEREIQNSQITGESFAVVFIDIDQFKSINDFYGHTFGTAILNELGNHLKKYIRQKDALFRYGGDEFVAVLSGCDLKTAQDITERMRASIQKKRFMYAVPMGSLGESPQGATRQSIVRLTISVGLALFPNHAQGLKELMEAADQAMYVAKKLGKNRVAIAFQGVADLKKISIRKKLKNRARTFAKGSSR